MEKRLRRRILLGAGLFLILTLILLKSWIYYVPGLELKLPELDDNYQVKILQQEAQIRPFPGTHKLFQWAFPDRRQTDLALVSLHGFSATRREISPLPEQIAEKLKMNLFMTRLQGHGLGAAGMGSLTDQGLLDDAAEALAVGEKMGKRVVLIGVSTGATLALELAARYPDRVAGLILVSPNFRPSRWKSVLVTGPVGSLIARYVVKEHRWSSWTETEAKYWTTAYPTTAVHEMMNLLAFLNQRDLKEIKTPAILFNSDKDRVVSLELIRKRMAQYGGPLKIEVVADADHVLVGDIKGPTYNQNFLKITTDFISGLSVD